jgi:hypothetical protein
VSDQKCLECHSLLKERIDQQKGYHSSKEVTTKNCADCHSDHHGTAFEMIRFDQDNFEHELTGYKLQGAHKTVDCRECHKPDNIANEKIRKIPNTFLGLGTNCLECHEDYHQNTLDRDCLSCHNMDAFENATGFNHAGTNFPLKGKHRETACIACHEKITKNGKTFQQFSGIPHSTCSSCHTDVHQGSLGNACVSCHSESTFSVLNKNFDHNRTGFVLEGKHRQIDCKDCHSSSSKLTNLFKEFKNVNKNDCLQCHEDIHQGKFGTSCLDCHSVFSFAYQQNTDKFNHNVTDFPLTGAHVSVDCKDCHKTSLTDPLAHETCNSCHENYHAATFSEPFLVKDCKECHTVDGFSPSIFGFEDHQKTGFPLEGAHQATPCIFCHVLEDKWEYKALSTKCISCHEDIHQNYLDQKYYPENDCRNCHVPDNWKEQIFEHSVTGYKLEGKHIFVNCVECHKPDNTPNIVAASPVFKVSSECRLCHNDIHREQFADIDAKTNCAKCHSFNNWDAVHFNHDSTRFKLDGAHLEVDCTKCHYEVSDKEGKYILYSLNTIECSDCH